MTALSASSELVVSVQPSRFHSAPVAASQLLYYGAMIVLDAVAATAKEVSGTAQGHLRVIGVARGALAKGTRSGVTATNADNSSGAAGDINVLYEVGNMSFANDTGANALAAADIGALCFAKDDATVSKDQSQGNYPVAGVFKGLDENSRAIVEVGNGGRWGGKVLALKANADLSSLQNTIVKLANSSGVARVASATADTDLVFGILLNTPGAADAIAYVCVDGPAPCVVGGSNITAADNCAATTGGASIAAGVADNFVGKALESGTSGQTKMVLVQPGILKA